MPLIALQDVTVRFGGPAVLEGASLRIDEGERIGLVGRNGAGKSTLVRLMAGQIEHQAGEVAKAQGLKVAMLSQEVPRDLTGSVFDEVARGLGPHAELLAEFHRVGARYALEHSEALHAELVRLERLLEAHDGWKMNQRVEQVLSRMELSPDANCGDLSAGLKRRVLLARAIVAEPDLLLLDEPTNHLDLTAIQWLEDFLRRCGRAVLFISHDRAFIRNLAERVLDVDRGQVTSWACDYPTYLVRKEAALDAEAKQQALFDKRLAQEEAWIRTGIKARRTRNEGRVRALEALRKIRQQRRQRPGEVRMQAMEAERSGQLVIEAKQVSFRYGPEAPEMVRNFSTLITRGDKIVIVGPNGAGKSTLLKLLLGELTPQSGTIRHGTRLEIAYFDQLHAQLDEERSIVENVTDGADRITIGGQSRHIIGYLEDFLFSPEQSRRAVKYLSGGERNRLLLAKLFTKPSNLLVLDEPTNDLDLETLELLETLLAEYAGTVLLVSHDREFLNNVVTSTLVLTGGGEVREIDGGYDDWLQARAAEAANAEAEVKAVKETPRSAVVPTARPRKLSYKEQQELQALPDKIAALEAEQNDLHAVLADPEIYRNGASAAVEKKSRLAIVEAELARAYERWEALESV
jgi:ATP-binding cassette subfamily F protein uup